jgi:hypothetical protein
MLLLRSEEPDRGEHVSAPTLLALARAWYGDRLNADWRPRTAAESQRILDDLGLQGEFWKLPA